MDRDELRCRIRESVTLLEGYRSYSPMVDEAISSLLFIDDCMAEPTPRKMEKSRLLISKLVEEIAPYANYMPSLAATLNDLNRWFE
jgi:hypothetical protein